MKLLFSLIALTVFGLASCARNSDTSAVGDSEGGSAIPPPAGSSLAESTLAKKETAELPELDNQAIRPGNTSLKEIAEKPNLTSFGDYTFDDPTNSLKDNNRVHRLPSASPNLPSLKQNNSKVVDKVKTPLVTNP